jgi:hypothetical protein
MTLGPREPSHSRSRTGDWILWLDCDDYLDPKSIAPGLREAVAVVGPEINGIFGQYLIEKNGAIISSRKAY